MVSVICVCDRLDPLSPRIHLRPTRHLDVASHHEARECFCKILISAHALYVGEQRRDRNTFREGIEWTVDAPLRENTAFNDFAVDAPKDRELRHSAGSVQISGSGLHSPPPGGTGRGRPVGGSDDARPAGRRPRIAASQRRRAGGGFRGGLTRTLTA
jgi:hypothetical protein